MRNGKLKKKHKTKKKWKMKKMKTAKKMKERKNRQKKTALYQVREEPMHPLAPCREPAKTSFRRATGLRATGLHEMHRVQHPVKTHSRISARNVVPVHRRMCNVSYEASVATVATVNDTYNRAVCRRCVACGWANERSIGVGTTISILFCNSCMHASSAASDISLLIICNSSISSSASNNTSSFNKQNNSTRC